MIVVTGGAGFIGKHLVRALGKEQRRVIVVDKAPKPAEFSKGSRIKYLRADAANIASSLPRGNQVDLRIVHLAAETSVQGSLLRPLFGIKSNIGLTCSLLEFARRRDVDSFVFSSSAAVYGEVKRACRETDAPNPISPYAASKLAAEYYCRTYANVYGLPVRILRLFNVYGPGQSNLHAGVVTHFLKEVAMGKAPAIYGDGNQIRDFVFISDVVDAILTTIKKKLPNGIVMNIGSGRAITINELAGKVLRLLQANLSPRYQPGRSGDISQSLADVSFAREKLGFKARHHLDEGLKLTYSSFVSKKKVLSRESGQDLHSKTW